MSDDSLLWTHKPVQRNRPRPGEPLWSVQHGDVRWTAELFCHGEGIGWEARIFRDGELSIARTYLLRDVAVGWAKTNGIASGRMICPGEAALCLARVVVVGYFVAAVPGALVLPTPIQ